MHTLRVGKVAQAILLAGYSVALLAVTLLVQGGHGVRTNLEPFEDVRRLVSKAASGDVLSSRFLFLLVGILGNLVMFAAWGFLCFKFLDGRERPAWRSHVDVALIGFLFSAGIDTAQFFLPTRAADVNDVVWNVLGAVSGALVAHAGRELRLVWD